MNIILWKDLVIIPVMHIIMQTLMRCEIKKSVLMMGSFGIVKYIRHSMYQVFHQ